MDESTARDQRIFAPIPKYETFEIDGERVIVAIYNFMDLRVKDCQAVWFHEREMQAAGSNWPDMVEAMRRMVRLLCPALEPEHFEALTARQLDQIIMLAYGGTVPQPAAEGAAGAASPSPSAVSITPSP